MWRRGWHESTETCAADWESFEVSAKTRYLGTQVYTLPLEQRRLASIAAGDLLFQ